MSADLIACVLLSLLFLLVFFLADLLFLKLNVSAEYTRKIVHVLSGLLACTFIYYLSNPWWVLAICSSFLLLLYLSIRFNFLKGINAVKRKTHGSILFPLAVFLSFLFWYHMRHPDLPQDYLYLAPLLILAFSDVLAALTGANYPIKKFSTKPESKSLGGSLAFFISALIISLLLLSLTAEALAQALAIAFATTLAEALSKKGWDNLFIPIAAMVVLFIFY